MRQRSCRLFLPGMFCLPVAVSLAKAVAALPQSKAQTFGPRNGGVQVAPFRVRS